MCNKSNNGTTAVRSSQVKPITSVSVTLNILKNPFFHWVVWWVDHWYYWICLEANKPLLLYNIMEPHSVWIGQPLPPPISPPSIHTLHFLLSTLQVLQPTAADQPGVSFCLCGDCASGGGAACPLVTRLVVWSPAPSVRMAKCPWAQHWTPMAWKIVNRFVRFGSIKQLDLGLAVHSTPRSWVVLTLCCCCYIYL